MDKVRLKNAESYENFKQRVLKNNDVVAPITMESVQKSKKTDFMDTYKAYCSFSTIYGMSTGEWFVTILLTYIPIINIIMLLKWMISKRTPPEKKKYAQAAFIFVIILVVVILALFFVIKGYLYGEEFKRMILGIEGGLS